MSFLNPIGLLGLLSLPVILVLHLLRERQKRYVVSDLGLWAFLDKQVRGPRTRRVPITWLLLLDLLVATLLSLAWSQPQIVTAAPAQAPRHLVVVMDTSSSMLARDGLGSRFAQAKETLKQLTSGRGPRDIVTVVAAGRQARVVADSREDSAPQFAGKIDALQAGETGTALREAAALGLAAVDRSLEVEIHILSDGSIPASEQVDAGSLPYPVRWHLSGSMVDNQAVIAIDARRVSQNRMQVFARVGNFSSAAASREALLLVDGRETGRSAVALEPDASTGQVWDVTIDPQAPPDNLTVQLSGQDSLPEDDFAALGLQAGGVTRVLLVAEQPAALQQAVEAVAGTELTVRTPQEYAAASGADEMGTFDLTIFRSYLPPAWPDGHVLVVEPPEPGTEEAASQPGPGVMAAAGTGSQLEIPANALVQRPNPSTLVDEIDFSGVRWVRVWALANPNAFSPLLTANGTPILAMSELDQEGERATRVSVLLADLQRGNFTKHPAFPILMANLVEFARQAPAPGSFQTGEALPLPAEGSYASIEILPPEAGAVRLQEQWPETWTETNHPGLYRFRLTGMNGEITEFSAGALAGDRQESNLRPASWVTQAAGGGAPAGTGASIQENKIDLWAWLLAAAVLALLMEATLAWRS